MRDIYFSDFHKEYDSSSSLSVVAFSGISFSLLTDTRRTPKLALLPYHSETTLITKDLRCFRKQIEMSCCEKVDENPQFSYIAKYCV